MRLSLLHEDQAQGIPGYDILLTINYPPLVEYLQSVGSEFTEDNAEQAFLIFWNNEQVANNPAIRRKPGYLAKSDALNAMLGYFGKYMYFPEGSVYDYDKKLIDRRKDGGAMTGVITLVVRPALLEGNQSQGASGVLRCKAIVDVS